MRRLVSFIILMFIKTFSKAFFKLEVEWISDKKGFEDLRMVVLLNHTSLYEPLFLAAAPNWFLWRLAQKMVAPGADKTLNRPLVGLFWKFMAPGLMPITRKRDKSWFKFLQAIQNKNIVLIAPEGRMKRSSGFDSKGKPMSVRSGIAEIINEIDDGRILIGYSGGLHHVQHPGQLLPRLFQTIRLNLESVDVQEYKDKLQSSGIQFRKDVVSDLEARLHTNTP
ncbi:MAG: hypothetical protein HON90_15015 [Halobacteriovoraceae bacterium]|jgi:hypothetical protein|nr:hypothetical protein [Halobacteriovoraceae bacterium]